MSKIKKALTTCFITFCVVILGIGIALMPKTQKTVMTAEAAVATEYTIVDSPLMARISDCYAAGGSVNMFVFIPNLDNGNVTGDEHEFDGVNLTELFTELGFFDNVLLGEKTLRELGCTKFWDNKLGYNVVSSDIQPALYLHLSFDPAMLATAMENGDVSLDASTMTPITFKKGTVIPGYQYLSGGENAVLYRAGGDCTTYPHATKSYSLEMYLDTDLDSAKYVQAHDGSYGYFGVSFVGDDYAFNGGIQESIDTGFQAMYDHFANKILVNGETGKTIYYSLVNLGVAGKGHLSFGISVAEADVQSITIPAGTLFPFYSVGPMKDANGHYVHMMLRTQTEKVLIRGNEGAWVTLVDYRNDAVIALDSCRANKIDVDYFSADVVAMNSAVATAKAAIESAQTVAAIDEAVASAKAVFDSVYPKVEAVEMAKTELDAYKADMFREAEETQRLVIIEAAKTELDGAADKEALDAVVVAAKAEIDQLKTAAQYADEELASVKANAKEEISGYLAKENYYTEQQAEIDAVIAAGYEAVAAAKDEEEIDQAVVDAKAGMDVILTKMEVIAAIKAELAAYKSEEGLYLDAEKSERAAIVAQATEAIDTAADKAAIDLIVTNAKAAIDELVTAEEYLEISLAEAKVNAKAEIEAYLADAEYLAFQAQERLDAVQAGKNAVDAAKSEDEIATAVADAKDVIDAIATKYTVVNSAMHVMITDMYAAGGTIKLLITVPELDLPSAVGDGFAFDAYDKEALEKLFIDFGILDKIMINDKTLRAWGFVGFWDDKVGFNIAAPNPAIYLHMYSESQDFKDAVASGEIAFTKYENGTCVQRMSPVTVKKDLVIPGYSFLMGTGFTVYCASTEYVTVGKGVNYDTETVGKVEVGSGAYVREDVDANGNFVGGYFGVALEGADFPTLDTFVIAQDLYYANNYTLKILINGEEGKVNKFAVFGLGEKGQGRYSFSVTVPEAEMYSITIPAGTMFQSYGANLLTSYNGNAVQLLYEVQTTVTLLKTASGAWVQLDDYKTESIAKLEAIRANKIDSEYFTADVTIMNQAIVDAKALIESAASIADVDAAVAAANETLNAIVVVSETISIAKAELDAYKAGMFLETEETQRLEAIANAKNAMDEAASKEEINIAVEAAKAVIDALKTANQYAKEEIAEEVLDAKNELDAYKADLYREVEAAQRTAIIDGAKAELDEAITADAISVIVAAAKAEIDKLKTDAEYDIEEALSNAKLQALAEVNSIKADLDYDLYTTENQAVLNELYANAQTAIEAATTLEEVSVIATNFASNVEMVEKIDSSATPDSSTHGSMDEKDAGCFGSLSSASVVAFVLAMCVFIVFFKKQRVS